MVQRQVHSWKASVLKPVGRVGHQTIRTRPVVLRPVHRFATSLDSIALETIETGPEVVRPVLRFATSGKSIALDKGSNYASKKMRSDHKIILVWS